MNNIEKIKLNINRNFYQYDFMKLFLGLLKEQGIYKIKEKDLARSLFNYYNDKRFKQLFVDSLFTKSRHIDEVDIYSPIKDMLYCDYLWQRDNASDLYINTSRNDVHRYEDFLEPETMQAMKEMVNEYALRYKVEKNSLKNLSLYAVNPNKEYFLACGDHWAEEIMWNLITDGEIKSEEKRSGNESVIYSDPYPYRYYGIGLKNSIERIVELENAKYAIMQGLSNDKIMSLKLYSTSLDEDELKKLSMMANTDFTCEDEMLISDKPYVYKKQI